MPVTKTAKRALRASKRKEDLNKVFMSRLEVSLRKAKKSPTAKNVNLASSLLDKASKKKIFHKNKASRLKSKLAKLLKPKTKAALKANLKKTTSKKK